MAALVVGCLSPDFEYFLRGKAQGHFGHTLLGLMVFDLPLALLVLWLYRRYVQLALLTAAPRLFPLSNTSQPRPGRRGTANGFALEVISILVGGATHILWDSVTHPSFWPYRHIALLHRTFAFAAGLEFYKVLQHGSTLLGMSMLLILWWRWVRSASDPYAPVMRPAGLLLMLLAALTAVLRGLLTAALQPGRMSLPLVASQSVITLLDALALGLAIHGVVLRQRSSL